MISLFHKVTQQCSEVVTENYSTSFSSAIRLLNKDLRSPVHNIYGFVRFADEIVDTFHEFDKAELLARFKAETFEAIDRKISLNPILHSFQLTVNKYNIDHALIESFFRSMQMDIEIKMHAEHSYSEYIYGSAEAVGLMCLYVFCEGDSKLFKELQSSARALGAAFQKVNFLRDVKDDHNCLNRTYFPGVDFKNFTSINKREIELEIAKDFQKAAEGIFRLPWKARFGVYVAYKYYLTLFRKIRNAEPSDILEQRIRIPRYRKAMILVRAGVKNQLKLI